MTLDERIPSLTDPELQNLQANATRLAQSGTPAQKAEAARLLPLIETELGVRAKARTAHLADMRAKRKDAAAATRKARSAAKAAG